MNRLKREKRDVYGVELTPIQEMMFAKYRDSSSIAMNTLLPEERKQVVVNWLNDHKSNEKG